MEGGAGTFYMHVVRIFLPYHCVLILSITFQPAFITSLDEVELVPFERVQVSCRVDAYLLMILCSAAGMI